MKSPFWLTVVLVAGCANPEFASDDAAGDLPAPLRPAVVVELWPDGVPGEATGGVGEARPSRGDGVLRITNVGTPTMEVFPVEGAEGAVPAVLLLPGGGYSILAFDKEGTDVAAWLNQRGIAAAVLKYRVPKNRAGAFQDAQRALGWVRRHAERWGIDPERVGVFGSSAGGHLAVRLSTDFETRAYPRVDDADDASCRPDFAALLYPAYLAGEEYELVSEIAVGDETPPTFLVAAQDDRRYVASSVAYYQALARIGIEAELHLFPTGGHGFGMRRTGHAVDGWPVLFARWLADR